MRRPFFWHREDLFTEPLRRLSSWLCQGAESVEEYIWSSRQGIHHDHLSLGTLRCWSTKCLCSVQITLKCVIREVACGELTNEEVNCKCRARLKNRVQASYSSIILALRPFEKEYSQVVFVDPVGILCPDKHCQLVRDGWLVYRDSDHVFEFAARLLAGGALEERRRKRGWYCQIKWPVLIESLNRWDSLDVLYYAKLLPCYTKTSVLTYEDA